MKETDPLLLPQQQDGGQDKSKDKHLRKDRVVAAATSSTSTIPSSLRWTTNLLSLLAVFGYSGIIYGWAPLELLLLREGQYGETCGDDAAGASRSGASSTAAARVDDNDPPPSSFTYCPSQLIRLQVIFTVAQFVLSFVSLGVGWFLDHAPKQYHWLLAALVEISGLVLFAYADSKRFDVFAVSYAMMAFGGCMTMLGAFPASFLLHSSRQPAILAAISCFFDASSVVFFGFHRVELSWGHAWSRKSLFIAWALLGSGVYVALAACWSVLERKDWKSVLEREEGQSITAGDENGGDDTDDDDNDTNGTGITTKLGTGTDEQQHQHHHQHHHHHHVDPVKALHKLPIFQQVSFRNPEWFFKRYELSKYSQPHFPDQLFVLRNSSERWNLPW